MDMEKSKAAMHTHQMERLEAELCSGKEEVRRIKLASTAYVVIARWRESKAIDEHTIVSEQLGTVQQEVESLNLWVTDLSDRINQSQNDKREALQELFVSREEITSLNIWVRLLSNEISTQRRNAAIQRTAKAVRHEMKNLCTSNAEYSTLELTDGQSLQDQLRRAQRLASAQVSAKQGSPDGWSHVYDSYSDDEDAFKSADNSPTLSFSAGTCNPPPIDEDLFLTDDYDTQSTSSAVHGVRLPLVSSPGDQVASRSPSGRSDHGMKRWHQLKSPALAEVVTPRPRRRGRSP